MQKSLLLLSWELDGQIWKRSTVVQDESRCGTVRIGLDLGLSLLSKLLRANRISSYQARCLVLVDYTLSP